MVLNKVNQARRFRDIGDIVVLVEGIQMDAVDAAGAVLVDLVDGVFDAGLFEALLLAGCVRVKRLFVERVREYPVLRDDLAERAVHDAARFARVPC